MSLSAELFYDLTTIILLHENEVFYVGTASTHITAVTLGMAVALVKEEAIPPTRDEVTSLEPANSA